MFAGHAAAADLWLISVPDSQIAGVAQALAGRDNLTPALAVHASGALTAAVLAPLAERGWQTASAHPALSFAEPVRALATFEGTPVALEGMEDACQVLDPLLTAIGARPFLLSSEHKPRYHAACTIASNYVVTLADMAWRVAREAGLDAEMTQLERVFSSYPAFWEEWSGRLSRRPESKDAAIAGRFFSLSLQGRPVNWADVIDQGLRAFTEGQPARPRVADMPDLSLGSQPAERVARLEESVSRMPHLSLSLSQEQPAERTPSGPQHAELATKGWGFSLVENQEAEAAPQRQEARSVADVPALSLTPADEESIEELFEPRGDEPARAVTVTALEADEPDAVELRDLDIADEDAEEAPIFRNLGAVDSDEDFSLRTRSMAEILAEQGDYAGALEIYRELEPRIAPAERLELATRIDELEERLRESEEEARELEQYAVPGSDGTKLVDLLESLAKRLEARAR